MKSATRLGVTSGFLPVRPARRPRDREYDLLVVLQRGAHRFVDVAEDVGEVEWVRGAVSRMPCAQAAMYGWDEAGEPQHGSGSNVRLV